MQDFIRMEERPLHFETSIGAMIGYDQVTKHKAIVNPENERIVSVVGSGYQLVQNADVFPQFEDAIRLSALDTNGMERNIATSHGGGRTVVSYTFPEHRIAVKEDDDVDLTLTVLNSYDTSWKFRVLGGAFRLLCANGMIIGDTFMEYSGKHTASLDTERAIQALDVSLTNFAGNADMWKQYPKVDVTPTQAKAVFEKLSNGSKTMMKGLDANFLMYVDEVGHNLWALFNTLTEWSTHFQVKNKDNAPSIIVNREEKVRKLLPMLEDIRLAA
jgi:hypothetical protein